MRSRLLLSLLLAYAAASHSQDVPSVSAFYSEEIDSGCAVSRRYEIKEDWRSELQRRLPEFQSLLEGKVPSMIGAASAMTGKRFSARSFKVRLSLCDLPSQSFLAPSVNMRFALSSFAKTPVPIRYKVDTAFHEILHAFVGEYTPRASRLLTKYAGETDCVKNHLHLLALQKAVLLSLNAQSELADVVAIDSQLPSGCYKRAWSIVNESATTYKEYVAELSEA
jgi:hypothetical protein